MKNEVCNFKVTVYKLFSQQLFTCQPLPTCQPLFSVEPLPTFQPLFTGYFSLFSHCPRLTVQLTKRHFYFKFLAPPQFLPTDPNKLINGLVDNVFWRFLVF